MQRSEATHCGYIQQYLLAVISGACFLPLPKIVLEKKLIFVADPKKKKEHCEDLPSKRGQIFLQHVIPP